MQHCAKYGGQLEFDRLPRIENRKLVTVAAVRHVHFRQVIDDSVNVIHLAAADLRLR